MNFETLQEAKDFCEDNAKFLLVEGEMSEICIKYIRSNGYSSYFMYNFDFDVNSKDKNIEITDEWEETEFEYLDNHAWVAPYWKKAKKVNERSYCAGDVLRVSFAHSPLSVISLIGFSSLVFAAVLILLSVTFYNVNEYMSNFSGIANTMIFIQAALVLLGLVSIIVPYVKSFKIIKQHQKNFNEIDWKETMKHRHKYAWGTVAFLFASVLTCVGLIIMTDMISFTNQKGFTAVRRSLIILIIIHAIRLLVFLGGKAWVYVRMAKIVNHLFGEAEWEEFKKWLKTNDSIWEFRTNVEFFVIPHEVSLPYVTDEKTIANQIIDSTDTVELKVFARRAKRNYRVALKKHWSIMEVK